MSKEAARSRVLVVGVTGRLGGSLARASLAAGHHTFALVRPHHLARPGSPLLEPLIAAGATLLQVNARYPYHLPRATAHANAFCLFAILRA
jgi:uncharacterized protein YbjT (DUF2867 family)